MNVDVAYDPGVAACNQLALAHDRFAETEQVLVAEGKYIEAQGAHEYAALIVRAYKAELDDPKPEGLP